MGVFDLITQNIHQLIFSASTLFIHDPTVPVSLNAGKTKIGRPIWAMRQIQKCKLSIMGPLPESAPIVGNSVDPMCGTWGQCVVLQIWQQTRYGQRHKIEKKWILPTDNLSHLTNLKATFTCVYHLSTNSWVPFHEGRGSGGEGEHYTWKHFYLCRFCGVNFSFFCWVQVLGEHS